MFVNFILATSFLFSCDKSQDTSRQIIMTENKILNGFGIEQYVFKKIDDKSFSIGINGKEISNAEISFIADLENFRQIHRYIDQEDNFEITFNNKEGILYLNDKKVDLKYEIYFNKELNGFVDKISGKKIEGNDWLTSFKINKIKYMILSTVIDEVLNGKKLFVDPIKEMQEVGYEKNKREAVMNIAKNKSVYINRPNVLLPGPCSMTIKCPSRTYYQFNRTRCSTEAHHGAEACCNNQYCIGCCSYKGCNFGGIFGDFLGICTEDGEACGRAGGTS